MSDLSGLGKILILLGAVMILAGLALVFAGKIPWIGRLPGDILYKGKNVTFFFPITTSILISIVISVILYFLSRK